MVQAGRRAGALGWYVLPWKNKMLGREGREGRNGLSFFIFTYRVHIPLPLPYHFTVTVACHLPVTACQGRHVIVLLRN